MVFVKYSYQQIPEDQFEIIKGRYAKYLATIDDLNSEPVKVFDSLSEKQMNELELIREVSKELQKNKEEDMKKAAAAKAEEVLAKKEEKLEEKSEVEESKKEE